MMVTSLALTSKLWQTNEAVSFCRLSLFFLRSLCDVSSSSGASSVSDNATAKRKNRKKKKNLFEVAQFLPNWGLGYHMAKSHWENVSYEITKINLYKGGRHGKAWGIAHKQGVPADAPKKISGVNKRCWRFIQNSQLLNEKRPILSSPKATEPSQEDGSISTP